MRTLWIIVLALGASVAQGQTTRTDCYGYGNSIHCDSRNSGVSDQLGRSLSRSMAPDIAGSFERGRQQVLQRQLLEEQQRQLHLQNELLQQQLNAPAVPAEACRETTELKVLRREITKLNAEYANLLAAHERLWTLQANSIVREVEMEKMLQSASLPIPERKPDPWAQGTSTQSASAHH